MRELASDVRRPLVVVLLLGACSLLLLVASGRADNGGPSGPRPAPIVYRPPGLDQSKKVPLVVMLHGSGSTPAAFERWTRFDQVADQHGFVVAYLGSAVPSWKDVSNVGYIGGMIDELTASENIDPQRVYVAGFSAGGFITYWVACELSQKVAGVAVVSNTMVVERVKRCAPRRPVSELAIVGTADGLIPPAGNANLPSAAATAARWGQLDGCPTRPRTDRQGQVVSQTWGPCLGASAVTLDTIEGGRHWWPGSSGLPPSDPDAQISASQAIWTFFAAHPASVLPTLSVRVVKLTARGTGAGRRVVLRLAAGRPVSVRARVLSGGRVVASKSFPSARASRRSLVVSIPRRAASGRAVVSIVAKDAYGASKKVAKAFRLPA